MGNVPFRGGQQRGSQYLEALICPAGFLLDLLLTLLWMLPVAQDDVHFLLCRMFSENSQTNICSCWYRILTFLEM